MNCLNFKVRSKDYKKYCYCNLKKEKISCQECVNCKYKEFKKTKSLKNTSTKKSVRSKSTDISYSVKQKVFERDHGCCVVCGNRLNVMPNAHYISRAQGGLGIEKILLHYVLNLQKKNVIENMILEQQKKKKKSEKK